MKRLPTFLFIIAIVATAVGFVQLAVYQRQASKLIQSIMAADKTNSKAVVDLEQDLASHARTHMGTSKSYVLEGSYKRATEAAQAAANPGSNGQVYAQAQTACGGQSDSVSQARCVQNYLATHATPAANPKKVTMPNKNDKTYTKKVVSPGWTPDSTGLAFLTALTALALSIYVALVRRH